MKGKKSLKKKNMITVDRIRNHNHELLEIILEAKVLSSEDGVIEVLQRALKVDRDRSGRRGSRTTGRNRKKA